eukprot:1746204-Lingulodinium_polyedra.AAC.1
MDSWDWRRRYRARHGQRPSWFHRPAQELQAFTEDALWFRRNSPHIETRILDRILEQASQTSA